MTPTLTSWSRRRGSRVTWPTSTGLDCPCSARPTRRARRRSTSIASAARTPIPAYQAEDESQIMLRKNFAATGSFIEDDRPRALDLLGFASQLVFDTFTSSHVLRIERAGDPELSAEVARGQRRAMLDWCSVDPRLLPVCVVPLGDMPAAIASDARGDRRWSGRVADRPVLPARSLAEPHRPRADVGDGRRSRRAGGAARCRRGRQRDEPRLLRERPAAGTRLPRGRRQLQVDRLPVDPVARDADAERARDRRGVAASPATSASA